MEDFISISKNVCFSNCKLIAISMVLMLSSCQPARIIVLDSEGIVSYDRHTGKFEMLWETHSRKDAAVTDSIDPVPERRQ